MTLALFSAAFAVLSMFVAEFLYMRDVYKRKTKPHLFSWIIWGALVAIAAAVQLAEGAPIAALASASGAVFCFVLCALSFSRGEKRITRSDWISFILALSAIPAWMAAQDPLPAAILLVIIDVFGSYPTYRKSWSAPQEETVSMYALYAVSDIFICLATLSWPLASILYPAASLLINGGLVFLLLARRRSLGLRPH